MNTHNEREMIEKLAEQCDLYFVDSSVTIQLDGLDWGTTTAPHYIACAEDLEAFAKAYAQQSMTSEAVNSYKDLELWLIENMPSGTVIGDPKWWANQISKVLSYTHAPNTEQQQSEPVAWRWKGLHDNYAFDVDNPFKRDSKEFQESYGVTPLFTHPPASVPLEKYNKLLDALKEILTEWNADVIGSEEAIYKVDAEIEAIAEAEGK